jgi:amidohydrolase
MDATGGAAGADAPVDEVIAREKKRAKAAVESLRPLVRDIIEQLNAYAEVGGEESQSSALLKSLLADAGFAIESGVADLPTAFVATAPTRAPGPCIAFLAEYDALPGIGHACGHNASAATSIAAAVAVMACQRKGHVGGTATVVGTPGEENLSGKVQMLEHGVFRGIDAALMMHAFDRWASGARILLCDTRQFTFFGRAAHAAAAPESGLNALDGVMLTFQGVNCLRQHMIDGSRIHGIVTDGGEVPNVVPERAQALFYIRAGRRSYLDELTSRVEQCAKGAALMTGTQLEVSSVEDSMEGLLENRPFVDLYEANLARALGSELLAIEEPTLGSTDAGNVSHVVPTIHPLGAFAPRGTDLHTPAFAQATRSSETLDAVVLGATALAQTAIDLLMRPDSMAEVRRAFQEAM